MAGTVEHGIRGCFGSNGVFEKYAEKEQRRSYHYEKRNNFFGRKCVNTAKRTGEYPSGK